MSDVETTDKYKNTKQVVVTCLEIMNKVGRKWKYRVKNKSTNDIFILQTTIEPRDLPVTMKVGKDYIFPVIMNKVGKVGNVPEDPTIDYSVLIQDFEVPSSSIPEVEQAELEPIGIMSDEAAKEGGYSGYIIPKLIPPANDKPLVHSEDIGGGRVSTKEGSQLAVTEPDQYQVMDTFDGDQIVDELKGKMIEEYVYQFMQGGKLVTGIAYAGIKHITSRRGGYEDIDFKVTWNEEFKEYEAWAKIRDNTNGNTAIGLAYQSKTIYSKKLGKDIPNKFAKLMAYGKARRNGLRTLMDEAPIKLFVAQWLKENKK